jgi:hypothetical protein
VVIRSERQLLVLRSRRLPRLLAVATIVAGLAGCLPTASPPQSFEAAVSQALADRGITSPVEVTRATTSDDVRVVLSGKRGTRDTLALVTASNGQPWTIRLFVESDLPTSAIATVAETEADGKQFIYGVINDPRISAIEVEFLQSDPVKHSVKRPGYLLVLNEPQGPTQDWRFLDDQGREVLSKN